MNNILKNMFSKSKEVSKETIEETDLQAFTETMKRKMEEQNLSYKDLANMNLVEVRAEVIEEISKLEKTIEELKSKGANDCHSVYPFIKRRQEILETKTKRLLQLQSEYAISPDLYGAVKALDGLEKNNRGIALFIQASGEIEALYEKFATAVSYIGEASGYVDPAFVGICNRLAIDVIDIRANTQRMQYKNRLEIESRFFKALKRDDEIFKKKISIMNSVSEYTTVLEEPTEAISRKDMNAYEVEWNHIQQIISEDAKRRAVGSKKPSVD